MELVTTDDYLELAEKQKILREMYNLHIEVLLYGGCLSKGLHWQANIRDMKTRKIVDIDSDLYISNSYEAILKFKINQCIEYIKKQYDTSC